MEFAANENVVRYIMTVGDESHTLYAMVIPERLPPSFNEMITKSFEYTKNQRRWFQHFMSRYCRAMPPCYLDKRAVRIDLFKKSKADDAPNLDGRSKVILDSMKQLGMIVDDDNRYLDWGRVWQRKHSDNATVILVSETMDARLLMECHNIAPHALELVTNV